MGTFKTKISDEAKLKNGKLTPYIESKLEKALHSGVTATYYSYDRVKEEKQVF